jgi:hypothetical protein
MSASLYIERLKQVQNDREIYMSMLRALGDLKTVYDSIGM